MDDAELLDDALEDVKNATAKMEKQVKREAIHKTELRKASNSIPKEDKVEDIDTAIRKNLGKRVKEDLAAVAKRQNLKYDVKTDETEEFVTIYYGPLMKNQTKCRVEDFDTVFKTLYYEGEPGRIRYDGIVYENIVKLMDPEDESSEDVIVFSQTTSFFRDPSLIQEEEVENIDVETVLAAKIGDGSVIDQIVKERLPDDTYASVVEQVEKPVMKIDPQGWFDRDNDCQTWSEFWEMYFSEYGNIIRGLWDSEPEDNTWTDTNFMSRQTPEAVFKNS